MTILLKEHDDRPITCEWCGNVRNKKVRVTGTDGSESVVCKRHFQHHDGTIVNDPTAEAIIRLWSTPRT